MKRQWNWLLWVGFVVAVAGLFSYGFFVRFPITRDFPWANLLLFGIGDALLIVGLFRAFGRPQLYRGKIFGSILTAIALFLFAFFSCEIFYVLRQVPLSANAPRLGERRRTSCCWIKTNNRSAWVICFLGRELLF